MRSQSVILCLALAGLLGPLTAHSAPAVTTVGADTASRVVRFGDLNLDSRAGVTVLYSRIKSAAEVVCEPAIFSTSNTYLRQRRCEQRAIEQAVLDVGSPRLTSFHMSKTNPVATAQVR
jgi:UrcA family protein